LKEETQHHKLYKSTYEVLQIGPNTYKLRNGVALEVPEHVARRKLVPRRVKSPEDQDNVTFSPVQSPAHESTSDFEEEDDDDEDYEEDSHKQKLRSMLHQELKVLLEQVRRVLYDCMCYAVWLIPVT